MEKINETARKQIAELKELCFEYPPDLKRIEDLLDQIDDFHDFYCINMGAGYVIDHSDFLAEIISEYFERINDGYFGKYVYNDEKEDFDFITPEELPELRKETYITKIVELFLQHGYDLNHMSGLVGASCLDALVYSMFNDELCNVARLLIDYGADPTIHDEEGFNTIDKIETACLATADNRSDYSDEYFDNLCSLYTFEKLCLEAEENLLSKMRSV